MPIAVGNINKEYTSNPIPHFHYFIIAGVKYTKKGRKYGGDKTY